MENLFGQIECRSKSDLIVMRVLRSAMDKAHEKVQSKDGPIEFLHERSTFYELASILVEGGLNIVQEEMDILEGSHDKILSELMEIKLWLQGRILDMKHLIIDKDKELTERLENESKLMQALELKDRELVYLQEKLEPEKMSNEDQEDISRLKSSVDQQVWNIKQKLEDEEKILATESKKMISSHVSSPNLSFEFLDKERNESSRGGLDHFCESTRFDQNVLIRRMSSDIDILKETLDFAFGRMHSNEVLPLEKQWRCTIEKDIESLLVKHFLSDLKRGFDVEEEIMRSVLKEDVYMVFFREMIEEWKCDKDDCTLENLIKEDIYQFFIVEATKESQALKQVNFFQEGTTPRFRKLDTDNSRESTPRFRKLDMDNSRESTPRFRKLDMDNSRESTPRSRTDGEESLIGKLDSLLKCLEAEEDLMLRASCEIKEQCVNNSLVILNCEEIDERNAIEWLLNDDESMFSSVSEKLERALQQLYTSKELLGELEESLEVFDDDDDDDDDLGENNDQLQCDNVLSIKNGENHTFLQQDDDHVVDYEMILTRNVLEPISQFQQVVKDFEHMVHDNLENKCLRMEVLKSEMDTLIEPLALIRTRKLLYKKAFILRCHNLNLAESEVDLLGNQVETLLRLLERIYNELNKNAAPMSQYFEVFDILKLIRTELNNGDVCTKS